jgi:hypothetical protein
MSGKRCVGCDDFYEEWEEALSRKDNRTHVCNQCGVFEAVVQHAGEPLEDYGWKGWLIARAKRKEVQQ